MSLEAFPDAELATRAVAVLLNKVEGLEAWYYFQVEGVLEVAAASAILGRLRKKDSGSCHNPGSCPRATAVEALEAVLSALEVQRKLRPLPSSGSSTRTSSRITAEPSPRGLASSTDLRPSGVQKGPERRSEALSVAARWWWLQKGIRGFNFRDSQYAFATSVWECTR